MKKLVCLAFTFLVQNAVAGDVILRPGEVRSIHDTTVSCAYNGGYEPPVASKYCECTPGIHDQVSLVMTIVRSDGTSFQKDLFSARGDNRTYLLAACERTWKRQYAAACH